MIHWVKEGQSLSDLIKLCHIGFNLVKRVKDGQVLRIRVNLGQSGSNMANFGQIELKRSYCVRLVQKGQSRSNGIKLRQLGQSGSDWVKHV